MRVLVTGGAGFVGVHVVDQLLRRAEVDKVVVLDAHRHTAVPHALTTGPRLETVRGDIRDARLVDDLVAEADIVIHLAAETFVDAAIADDRMFVDTNISGTAVLLRALGTHPGRRLLHISTDEVFGQSGRAPFTERSAYRPRNPYSATKAAADHLVRSYIATHGVEAVICHFSNLFGRWQYPEKLIPVTVTRLLAGDPAHVFGSGNQSRTWLHVSDATAGLLSALDHGAPGRSYLIGGEVELTTLEIVYGVADLLQVPREQAVVFVADRRGHDQRYAIDNSDTRSALCWKPSISFGAGLADTVTWMSDNNRWWNQ